MYNPVQCNLYVLYMPRNLCLNDVIHANNDAIDTSNIVMLIHTQNGRIDELPCETECSLVLVIELQFNVCEFGDDKWIEMRRAVSPCNPCSKLRYKPAYSHTKNTSLCIKWQSCEIHSTIQLVELLLCNACEMSCTYRLCWQWIWIHANNSIDAHHSLWYGYCLSFSARILDAALCFATILAVCYQQWQCMTSTLLWLWRFPCRMCKHSLTSLNASTVYRLRSKSSSSYTSATNLARDISPNNERYKNPYGNVIASGAKANIIGNGKARSSGVISRFRRIWCEW